MKTEVQKCKAVLVMNAKTCLQQPDLYEQNLSKQFIDIYQSEDSFLSCKYFLDIHGIIKIHNRMKIYTKEDSCCLLTPKGDNQA